MLELNPTTYIESNAGLKQSQYYLFRWEIDLSFAYAIVSEQRIEFYCNFLGRGQLNPSSGRLLVSSASSPGERVVSSHVINGQLYQNKTLYIYVHEYVRHDSCQITKTPS